MPWGKASGTGLAGESLLGTRTDGLRYARCSLRAHKERSRHKEPGSDRNTERGNNLVGQSHRPTET